MNESAIISSYNKGFKEREKYFRIYSVEHSQLALGNTKQSERNFTRNQSQLK